MGARRWRSPSPTKADERDEWVPKGMDFNDQLRAAIAGAA
jgi:hypothetical protein